MALTNAERQARRRERHLKSEMAVVRSVHFRRQHQGAAQADRPSQGCSVTSLIKEWAASPEHRITHQISGKALKQYYDGE
jgi:hypothetical protein